MAIPTRREYCQKRVFSGEGYDFRGHNCSRKPVKNGLCALHQPKAIEARQKKLKAKWAAEREVRDEGYRRAAERQRRADCFDALVAALKVFHDIQHKREDGTYICFTYTCVGRAALDLANRKE